MTAMDRNSSTMLFCTVFIIFTIILTTGIGCSPMRAYEGESRGREEVAVVRGYGVRFHRVNGRPYSVTEAGVEVLPGSNAFELTLDNSNFNSDSPESGMLNLDMNAEAGKSYAITARRGDGRLCAFPVIPETGDPDLARPAGCVVKK